MPLIISTSTSAGVTIYHGEVSHVVRVRVAGLEWMLLVSRSSRIEAGRNYDLAEH
jgi:hypothetical protein